MSRRHRLFRWMAAAALAATALGVASAEVAQDRSATARVVYSAAPTVDVRFATDVRTLAQVDTQDARRSARNVADSRLGQRVIFSTEAGERTLSSTNAPRGLEAVGFVSGHLIVRSLPGQSIGPNTSRWILQIEGRVLPEQSDFAAVPPAGAAVGLVSGLDAINSNIVSARVVGVRGREGDRWAALYLVEQRNFEGVKRVLRVRTYAANGSVTGSADGPAVPNLGQVGYVDAPRLALVMRDGSYWGVTEGKVVDQIKGVQNFWFVNGLDAFYSLDVGEQRRPWGLTDAASGVVVAGGDDARELVLSHVELDTRANARKTVVARVVVPVQGPPLPDESERYRRNAQSPPATGGSREPRRMPTLVFGGMATRQAYRMPKTAEEAMRRSLDESAGARPQTETLTQAQPTAEWSALPSHHGVTLFTGSVIAPAQNLTVQLALLVGPGRDAAPVALSYGKRDGQSGVGFNWGSGLASSMPGGAGGAIGLQLIGSLPGNSSVGGHSPANPAFLFDPSSGRIAAVPPLQAAAPSMAAVSAAAAPAASGPVAAGSDPATPGREAAALLDRHLVAYNARDLDALMALYDDAFSGSLSGGRYNRRVRISSNGDMGTMPTLYNKAMLRQAYEAHFSRVPASQLRVLSRQAMGRNAAGKIQIRERRGALSTDAPAPDFESGEVVYEFSNGRIRYAFFSVTP